MFVFGIDIGGTNIKLGLFNEKVELLDNWLIPTNPNSIFIDITNEIKTYCSNKKISFDEVLGYGIGIPGLVREGVALNCVNLNWKNINIVKEFKKAIGYDANVVVANDANLAAYGEYSLHKDKYRTIILITIGTGVGGGVITNGEIIEGANGLSGELGHIRIENDFKFRCSCGKIGCLETVASATGILRLANKFSEIETKKQNTYSSAKEVIDLARQNDKHALKAFHIACKNIAKALAMISVTLNPDAFIIGGGVSAAGEYLVNTIREYYLLECFESAKEIDIYLSELRNNAGITGGAALIIKKGEEKNGKC